MDTLTAPRATDVGGLGGLVDTQSRPALAGPAAPSWPAIAAWGAGLVQLALGAGAIMTAGGGPAIRVAGILLVVIGAGALGWGAATLARGRIVVPRLSIAGSLAGILAATAAMVLDPTRVSVFAVAAGIALLIAVALGSALTLRRARHGGAAKADAGHRHLVGLILGAVLVAGIVTPALAATEAGQHAVPHGEMVEPGHH